MSKVTKSTQELDAIKAALQKLKVGDKVVLYNDEENGAYGLVVGHEYEIKSACEDYWDIGPAVEISSQSVCEIEIHPVGWEWEPEEPRSDLIIEEPKVETPSEYVFKFETFDTVYAKNNIVSFGQVIPKGTAFIVADFKFDPTLGERYQLEVSEGRYKNGLTWVTVDQITGEEPEPEVVEEIELPPKPEEVPNLEEVCKGTIEDINEDTVEINFDGHYAQKEIEPIDVIEETERRLYKAGVEPVKAGNAVRALKYLLRAGLKDGEDAEKDLRKAANYMHRAETGRWLSK